MAKMQGTRLAALAAATAVLTSATQEASAQNYPVRPIRLVTSSVGNTTDITARILAPVMSAQVGQQIVVDNRGGGNAGVAVMTVLMAPRDGYTLLLYGSTLWLAPLMAEVTWNAVRDFAPISLVASAPNILVVHPSLPVQNVKELIALAKAKPGTLNYASGGSGSSPHLAAELLKSMAQVNIVRVAYKGGGPALIDVMGGQVQMTFAASGSVTPHLKSGRLRALAVSSLKPSALAPGLPTIAASGLPGFVTLGLYPVLAPVGTPTALVNRVHQEIVRAIARPETQERLLAAGVEAVGGTPAELAALIKSEIAMWGKVIKEAGIRDDTQ